MKTQIRKTVIAAMFAALACVMTMIIKIPSPLKGYINLGDCAVLAAGWLLSPALGFAAAGIGSALADVFSGYALYAPATFVIKGLMALTAYLIYKKLQGKIGKLKASLVSGFVAELIMIAGYFIFEGFIYGFAASLVNIPANAVQGAAGLVLGTVLLKILDRIKLY